MLVDQDQMLHEYFDVLKKKKLFGKAVLGTERSTFIVNQEGILIGEFRNAKSSGHAREILEFIKQLDSVV